MKVFVIIGILPLLLYLWPSELYGDTQYVIVYGISMLPTIEHGSLAIVKKVPDYDIYDIVSYKEKDHGRLVVHRIIDKVDNGFIIKGDNNRVPDSGPVSIDEIDGKVIFVTPYVGYFAMLLKNPMVLTLFIITVGGLVTSKNDKKLNRDGQKRKDDYSMFLPAMVTNLALYMVIQMSISMGTTPKTEGFTNYLFTIFEPSIAGTFAFATWHFVILGIYFIANHYQEKYGNAYTYTQNGQIQIQKKENAALFLAQIFWLLFVTIQMIYIVNMLGELMPKLTG